MIALSENQKTFKLSAKRKEVEMFEIFDLFSEEIIVTFLAFCMIIIPVGIFLVVKAAKEAGKQQKKEDE